MPLSTGAKRKTRVLRTISAIAMLAVVGSGFFLLNSAAAQSSETTRPSIGLVNEDISADFNGKEYSFGAAFVDLISKDSSYNWTVLSRPVSEKAYKDGSVDAVIYLPQSFSKSILTLEEVNPTKATVAYKLQAQLDKYSAEALGTKVSSVVHGFNQSVIRMFFSSIANNIAGAEGQMNFALSNQSDLVSNLTSEVQDPFSDSMKEFSSFVSSTTGLKAVNTANIESQNTLIKSVTSSLTANSEALSGQLPAIEARMSRQAEINQVNAANSKRAIDAQATSDLSFYSTQHDALRTKLACQLSGLDLNGVADPCATPEGTEPSSLNSKLSALATRVENYNTTAEANRGSIDSAIQYLHQLEQQPFIVQGDRSTYAALRAQITALEGIRDSLTPGVGQPPSEYFAQNLTDLKGWSESNLTSVKSAPLLANEVSSIEVKDWSAYTPDATELYVDKDTGLQQSLTNLVKQGAKTSTQLAAGAKEVPDSSNQFDALLRGAKTTQSDTQKVLDGVHGLVDSGNAGLEENKTYYENFSTVLANTRTPGVDTETLYDFFSAPIDAKNITHEQVKVTQAFDLRWVIIFAAGLLLGVLASVFSRTFHRKRATVPAT